MAGERIPAGDSGDEVKISRAEYERLRALEGEVPALRGEIAATNARLDAVLRVLGNPAARTVPRGRAEVLGSTAGRRAAAETGYRPYYETRRRPDPFDRQVSLEPPEAVSENPFAGLDEIRARLEEQKRERQQIYQSYRQDLKQRGSVSAAERRAMVEQANAQARGVGMRETTQEYWARRKAAEAQERMSYAWYRRGQEGQPPPPHVYKDIDPTDPRVAKTYVRGAGGTVLAIYDPYTGNFVGGGGISKEEVQQLVAEQAGEVRGGRRTIILGGGAERRETSPQYLPERRISHTRGYYRSRVQALLNEPVSYGPMYQVLSGPASRGRRLIDDPRLDQTRGYIERMGGEQYLQTQARLREYYTPKVTGEVEGLYAELRGDPDADRIMDVINRRREYWWPRDRSMQYGDLAWARSQFEALARGQAQQRGLETIQGEALLTKRYPVHGFVGEGGLKIVVPEEYRLPGEDGVIVVNDPRQWKAGIFWHSGGETYARDAGIRLKSILHANGKLRGFQVEFTKPGTFVIGDEEVTVERQL